jgi:hypothetical protein
MACPGHIARRSLGSYLGRKDKAHVSAFQAAGQAAFRNSPNKCTANTKNPPYHRCRRMALIGGDKCIMHLPPKERVAHDAKRRAALEATIETNNWDKARDKARASLKAAERRLLKYNWAFVDPRLPGQLIQFANARDERRCLSWLKKVGFDADGVSPVTNEPVTYRCKDRSLWAAAKYLIKQNISEARAMAKIRAAHNSDKLFFEKLARHDAGLPPLRRGGWRGANKTAPKTKPATTPKPARAAAPAAKLLAERSQNAKQAASKQRAVKEKPTAKTAAGRSRASVKRKPASAPKQRAVKAKAKGRR